MKETVRHIAGYLIGFTLFMVLIPLGLYKLSQPDAILHGKSLIHIHSLRYILSATVFLTGAFFAVWSNICLFRIGKGGPTDAFGISISPQTKKLVTAGPYRYSRNPMVFGAFSIYISLVILLNSLNGLILLILLFFPVALFLKKTEEKRLLKDFGDEYIEYKKRVPMIFPCRINKRQPRVKS